MGVVMFAQASVTLTLRSGETLAGSMIDLGAAGFEVSIGGNTRRIPMDQAVSLERSARTAGRSRLAPRLKRSGCQPMAA
jgi:hypothetical protein